MRCPPTAGPRTRASAGRARPAARSPQASTRAVSMRRAPPPARPADRPRARGPGDRFRHVRPRTRRPVPSPEARPPANASSPRRARMGFRRRLARRSRRRERRVPAARASSISSWTSLDLPTPASPPTRTVTCFPLTTCSRAMLNAFDSAWRPTRTGLTRLPATSSSCQGVAPKKSPARVTRRARVPYGLILGGRAPTAAPYRRAPSI